MSKENKESKDWEIPTTEQIYKEFIRLKKRKKNKKVIRNTFKSLFVVVAVAIIISYMFLPVLKVTGTSMEPTLANGDIVICAKYFSIKNGDVVAFYYNNKILVKRVIGVPGDEIDIDENGVVLVNGKTLDEPYVSELDKGTCEISFPFQVPENRLFVMGDNRGVSIDSRSVTVGCIYDESVIGKAILRIYPFNLFGKL